MDYQIKDETISFGDSIGLKDGSVTNVCPKSDGEEPTGFTWALYNKIKQKD